MKRSFFIIKINGDPCILPNVRRETGVICFDAIVLFNRKICNVPLFSIMVKSFLSKARSISLISRKQFLGLPMSDELRSRNCKPVC